MKRSLPPFPRLSLPAGTQGPLVLHLLRSTGLRTSPRAPRPSIRGRTLLCPCSAPRASPCLVQWQCHLLAPCLGCLGQQGTWGQVLQEMRMEICPQLHPQLLMMEQVPAHKHHLQFRHFPVTSSTCGPRPSTSWAADTFPGLSAPAHVEHPHHVGPSTAGRLPSVASDDGVGTSKQPQCMPQD